MAEIEKYIKYIIAVLFVYDLDKFTISMISVYMTCEKRSHYLSTDGITVIENRKYMTIFV